MTIAAPVTGTGAQRVRRRREKLRSAGLRPLQIWVPDTKSAGFAQECARQARLANETVSAAGARLDAAWFDTSDSSGWTE